MAHTLVKYTLCLIQALFIDVPKDESIGNNAVHQMRRFLSTVREGDHIISERKGNLYDHHGIYIGGGIVAHVRKRDGDSCEKCPDSTTETSERSAPIHSCIDCFSCGHPCSIIRYKEPDQSRNVSFFVSGSERPKNAFYGYKSKKLYAEWCKDGRYGYFEISKRRCTKYNIVIDDLIKISRFLSSKSAEQVKETAFKNYNYKYNLLVDNCEDFATFCKTYEHRSMQAEKRMSKPFYTAVKWIYQWNDRRKGRTCLRMCLESWSSEEPADNEMVAPAEVVPVPVEAIVDKADEDPIIIEQEECLRLLKAQEDPIFYPRPTQSIVELSDCKGTRTAGGDPLRIVSTAFDYVPPV